MKLTTPAPLQQEHEALHDELRRAKDVVAFAEQLVQHARTEEEVMYPAAVLVGRHVGLLLAQRGDQRVAA